MIDKTCNTCRCNKICDHNKYGFENCNNYVAMDTVEVIRCEKCKHYDPYENPEDFDGKCTLDGIERDKEFFCQYGK
jgi:hypothetical protein